MEDGALYRWKGLYFLMLLAQAILVWKTWCCVKIMHSAWENHQELLQHSTPKTVLSWPFKGAVRAFILSHECEKVAERKEEIVTDALTETEMDSCLVEPSVESGQQNATVWYYWPPALAQEHRLTREKKEFERLKDFARRMQMEQLQTAASWAGTVKDFYRNTTRIARQVVTMNSGKPVRFTDKCLDEHIVFGKVGLTARYLNMISLDGVANEMQNSTVEFKLESCNNLANISVVESYWSAENSSWQPTWCHGMPVAKNWSEKRKEEYNKLLFCLITCLTVKLVVTKLQSGAEQLSDRFANQRSRCDKRWESLFLEVFALMLFICLQSTLSTMFLLVWRPNCALATNIPSFGLVSCVGIFVVICVFNECDKCFNWTGRWCNGWCMAAFWLSFFIFLVLVTVPLCMLTFYNLQFFYQAYECQIRKQHASYISVEMKESALWCSRYTCLFVIFSMLEFLMLYLIDRVETQRERKPQTLPFKTTGTAYKLVNPH